MTLTFGEKSDVSLKKLRDAVTAAKMTLSDVDFIGQAAEPDKKS